MLRSLTCILSLLFIISCGNSLKLVEVKNDSGMVIERYYLDLDSLKTGIAESFDDDGNPFETASYEKGLLQGNRDIFFPNGKVEISEIYLDDKLHGLYKVFHENGNLKQEANYTNGVLEGQVESYYEEGGIKERVQFVENQENGPFVEFHPNGKKKWEGNYLNGDNEFGLLSQYDSTEVLIKKMNCDSLGMCQTVWTIEDGDVKPLFKIK